MKFSIGKTMIAGALAAMSLEASAQAFLELDTTPNVFGLGIGTVPDYRGSEDNTGVIAPFLRYTFDRSQRYFQINATEATLNLVDSPNFRFGPVLNYHPGRDDDVDNSQVARLRKIDGTVEAGVFAEYAWFDRANPRNRFIIGMTLLADAGGESEGFRARLNARYWRQVGAAVDLHIGGGVMYADSNYTDHYFGVNARNVGTSGLPFFNAGSGVNEYFLTLGGVVYLSKTWVGVAGVRLSQIAGDAKDSPLVSQVGDKSQVIGGIGLGYMWR
ncbi:MAG TPA: MipA/OmpV family protein [Burkholderiales bacterium]|nr:MipA/OmpV family protein [Burkholderiales bacterium]